MDHQLQTARQTMNEIDRVLNERVLNIQTIAGAPPIQNVLIPGNLQTGDFKKIGLKRINEFTTVTGPWDLLMMVDNKGKIVASSDEKQMERFIGEQIQNKIAYETAMREDYYYSDLVVSQSTGQFTVIFAAPIRNPNAPTRIMGTIKMTNFIAAIVAGAKATLVGCSKTSPQPLPR